MSHSTLIKLLGSYRLRKAGEEFIFNCPKCSRKKLEVNFRKAKFNCFYCNWGGRLSRLFKNFGSRVPVSEREQVHWKIFKKEFPMEDKVITIPEFFDVGEVGRFDGKYLRYLEKRGVDLERIKALHWGLSTDWRLRERIVIPILENGKAVCYVARSVEDGVEPKELSPPSSICNRSHFLYNIDSIKQGDRVVVVEGIFDCEAVVRAGIPCVSSLGSHMSDVQIGKLLAKKPESICLLFDGDNAGRKGVLDAFNEIWRRFNGRVRISICPDSKDPDELSISELKGLIE